VGGREAYGLKAPGPEERSDVGRGLSGAGGRAEPAQRPVAQRGPNEERSDVGRASRKPRTVNQQRPPPSPNLPNHPRILDHALHHSRRRTNDRPFASES
jgi:hypothetical protein